MVFGEIRRGDRDVTRDHAGAKGGWNVRPPHPATLVQRKMPPHPAKLTQAKSTAVGGAESWPAGHGVGATVQRAERPSARAEVKIEEVVGQVTGRMATVVNARYADYFVPYLPNKRINARRVITAIPQLPLAKQGETRIDLFKRAGEELGKGVRLEGGSGPAFTRRPKELFEAFDKTDPEWVKNAFSKEGDKGELATREMLGPLNTLEEWQQYYELPRHLPDKKRKDISLRKFRVMVNANWFFIYGLGGFPHLSPLTYVQGLAVSKGRVFSTPAVLADHTQPADALVISHKDDHGQRTIKIARHDTINMKHLPDVEWAVSGFKIVEQGKYTAPKGLAVKAGSTIPRTAVGISKDGDTLFIAVLNLTVLEKAAEFLVAQGAYEAINLDNSGSSQMLTSDGKAFVPQPDHQGTRPVPLFFAVV